ncbi:hypothetical protein K402DRAFT_418181 [Aulographum hederae CBS 113979]|uniref:Uncharacterized protein n=1 Tax=Aulographum hederae CBS 113979 TaxID=1176131 RepID=A0A6G1HAK9_9PEZI|nr:hypothetical protein K402DRAFT_418181 [Aulographum hederae CBS 113979]
MGEAKSHSYGRSNIFPPSGYPSTTAKLETAFQKVTLKEHPMSLISVRSVDSALAAFRVLDATEDIALFTPAIPLNNPNQEMDPFEPLGRALRHRLPVRHIPFVPKIGLTETHKAFLRCTTSTDEADIDPAGAAIAVICDVHQGSSNKRPTESFGLQLQFAQRVRELAAEEIPMLLVVFSETLFESYLDGFGTVVWSPEFSLKAMGTVAETIFG